MFVVYIFSNLSGALSISGYGAIENLCIIIIIIIIIINPHRYLLKAYSPVNRTGSPQDFSPNQILQKMNTNYNTKYAHFTNVKHINIIRKWYCGVGAKPP